MMVTDIGNKIIDFIIEHGLLHADDGDTGEPPAVIVWSANAAEQLDEFIRRMSILR